MIKGVGVDIVKVERVRAAVERWGERFLDRVYTKDEVRYSYGREPYGSLAVRFAAKEAVLKAIGPKGVNFTDIEVVSREDGEPYVKVAGRLEEILSERGIAAVHVSLSHEKDYGIAFAVAERRPA